MGLLTEVFRRGKGVVRSLSPTHPLLAWGRDATAFVAGHACTDRPFGPDSPFARLLERNACILCLDTGFASITFTHFVEDRLAETLSVPLYAPQSMTGIVIDSEGKRIECPTRVLSQEANQLRRESRLIDHLQRHRLLHQRRLGNSHFHLDPRHRSGRWRRTTRRQWRAFFRCAPRTITGARQDHQTAMNTHGPSYPRIKIGSNATNAPLISVCIPTYRGAAHLPAAIDSVLEQTLSDFELVIIDDNSPDQTAEIVSAYSDSRIRYLRKSVNLGPEGNWNRCLAEARGTYFKLFRRTICFIRNRWLVKRQH
ncbi:MAG: AAC(3) family N-acetyltransferase [Chromatiales bacterium]|nr:AAC(3) family N-acetyltransferase [Chromatiales bacterium]